MERENMKEVQSPEEIPQFENEDEEAEFWAAHSLGEQFLAEMEPLPEDVLPPVRPRTQPISLRLDSDVLERVRALAEIKHKGYQTLMKEFIVERLYEEEKREGILPTSSLADDARTPPETTKTQKAARPRNWQDEAFKFVEDHQELLENEDLDFITSANLLEEATTLLLEISNEIKRTSAMKGSRSNKMRRLIKGYDKLKEFCDRAFALHERNFGLPEGTEAESGQEPGDREQSAEKRKLRELKEEQRAADNVVIDARERFGG